MAGDVEKNADAVDRKGSQPKIIIPTKDENLSTASREDYLQPRNRSYGHQNKEKESAIRSIG